MIETADSEARQRFARELDRNFSVIASAGSGKTRAITDRIVEIARSASALERLPQLVVVTYTNRAADEMQQRTRQRILEAGLSLEVIEAFNRAFFGTIHSFCVKLLAAHGHHLGLPGESGIDHRRRRSVESIRPAANDHRAFVRRGESARSAAACAGAPIDGAGAQMRGRSQRDRAQHALPGYELRGSLCRCRERLLKADDSKRSGEFADLGRTLARDRRIRSVAGAVLQCQRIR